jgi:putative ABC transport system permease protein
MTSHLIRLIWNRKRHNFLLAIEIFCSFLVLFTVVLLGTHWLNNWRQPLGFNIERVWAISVDRKERAQDPVVSARQRDTYQQLFAMLADLPAVELAAGASLSPYSNSSWSQDVRLQDGRRLLYGVDSTTDAFGDLLALQIIAGRWFSKEDDAATVQPVVINRRMAREIFGEGNAVGQLIPERQELNSRGELPPARRVIGVIDDFRKDGEFSAPGPFLFYRMRLDVAPTSFNGAFRGPDAAWPPGVLLVRVAPGTTAAFEETLLTRLQAVAREWSFEVRPLIAEREGKLRLYAIPLIIVGTIAWFLLLMVALGLTGVVWQSVTERTQEFGLRRAEGATSRNVRRQVLVEIAIMTSIALVAGVVLVAQLPLLPLPPDVWVFPTSTFAASIALSVAAMYGLTLLCGWYPSRLATKIQPVEALRYE